jgi:hypothetical protein
MYHHKCGYGPGEPFATHSRRRYRLLPSRNPNHTGPAPDLSLWIIHYSPAEPQDRVPSNVIPVDVRIQQIMNIRAHLQAQGQIVQKEFMLHDRANWPQIAFPRGPPRGPQMYGGQIPPTRIPQNMAYPPQHAAVGPPAKRVRTQANANQAAASNAVAVLDADDEEDTSRGDLFDHTTPREISMSRYKQNHEWMEEILSSPYAINQIIPADLGLGVRGELATLTEGIFDAPHNPDTDASKNLYVGRLDPDKAEEFRKRANERIAQTNKEIERMKAKHAKRMAKFQKGSLITLAEKELRTAVHDPSDTGPEYWRLEGKIDEDGEEEGKTVTKTPSKVSDIVAKVEASVGRHAEAVKELIRIQDGGYEEAPAVPSSPAIPAVPSPQVSPPASHNGSNNSGVLINDTDMDMGNSAASLLDQFHTGLSSNSNATPGSNNFPTPQAHLGGTSASGTPSNMQAPSPHPPAQPTQQEQTQSEVQMGEASESKEQPLSTGTPKSTDWVVVPEGGISPADTSASAPASAQQPQAPSSTTTGEVSTDSPSTLPTTTTAAPLPPAPITSTQPSPLPSATATTSAANTPGLPDFHASPNDFADLGDLDSAGDALASYGDDMDDGLDGGDGDLGDLGMDMDVGMDDSAFGEAFHGVDEHRGEGGEGDNGLGDGL